MGCCVKPAECQAHLQSSFQQVVNLFCKHGRHFIVVQAPEMSWERQKSADASTLTSSGGAEEGLGVSRGVLTQPSASQSFQTFQRFWKKRLSPEALVPGALPPRPLPFLRLPLALLGKWAGVVLMLKPLPHGPQASACHKMPGQPHHEHLTTSTLGWEGPGPSETSGM